MKKTTLLFSIFLMCSFGFMQEVVAQAEVFLGTNITPPNTASPSPGMRMVNDCGQETPSNNFETGMGSLKNYNIANDFLVDPAMGIFTLETITFHAFVEPGGTLSDVDFTFYEDSGEGPGNLIVGLEDVPATSVEVIGEYEDDSGVSDVLEVYVELDEPLTFDSGEDGTVYWIGVQVPNYGGSSIRFELISEIQTPNETFVFLAGAWHGVFDLFGAIRDGVMTLAGSCEPADQCSEVSAGTLEGPASVCALSEFMITPVDATQDQSGISYMWEQSPLEEDSWSVIADATSYNLTMAEGIDEATKFRFTVNCDAGTSDTSAPFEITLNPADDCYCEPTYTLGCDDGDVINQVIIEDTSNEIIFQNDSGCSDTGYTDYTDTLDAAPLRQGETYTMTITSETNYAEDDDVRIWMDFNRDGFFVDEEEIGNTGGNGLDQDGVFSFDFSIPEDQELGTYRVRIRMAWLGGDDIDPCGNRSYGEAEDYAVEVTEALGVEDQHFDRLNLFPNPTENQVYLISKNPIEDIKLYNMMGQEVFRASPNSMETQFETQHLTAGIYLIKVTIAGVEKSYKIIKK